jgi:FkbM family methyltransferase
MTIKEINSYETRFLYNEIFEQEVYASYSIAVPESGVIFDVGANIGLFALYAAQKFHSPMIYSFEPAPHCLEVMRKNLSALGERVKIFGTAVGRESGEAEFTYYPQYTIMSGIFADENRDLNVLKAGARTQYRQRYGAAADEHMIELLVGDKLAGRQTFTCPVTTISKVIEAHNIDRIALAKIDVERAEIEILAGIKERDWPKIQQLVIEVHDQGGGEHEATRRTLVDKGYQVKLICEPNMKNSDIYIIVARRG